MLNAEVDLLALHPRLSGNRRRGWGLVAFAVLILAASCGGLATAGRNAPGGLIVVCLMLPLLALGAGAVGIVELRRPIQMDGSGRCRNKLLEGAELRWHPTFRDLADEVQVELLRTRSTRSAALAEMVRGRVVARLVLESSPLAKGSAASMRFSVKAQRDWFLPDTFSFQLRCLRETPRPLFAFRAGLECVAEAACVQLDLDTKGVYTVTFELPKDAPGSDLLAEQPVYWELTAEGHGRFAGMRGRIFLPVSP